MKHLIFVGAVALCTAVNAADSITTRNGVTYTNAVIQRADPDGVVVEYAPQPGSVGMAKLKFANLPDELRTRYNYNASDAATFEQNQTAGIARRHQEIAEGEMEKKRRHDELVQQKADEDALEARRQEMAARVAEQMQMAGGYGGYYEGGGDWYGIGHRRFRYNSPGPLNPHGDKFDRHDGRHDGGRDDSRDYNRGVGLSGLGTGWGKSGHWGPVSSQASRGPSHSGAYRSPGGRGKPSKYSAESR